MDKVLGDYTLVPSERRSTEKVLEYMVGVSLQPCTIQDLEKFRFAHPEVLRERSVVAVGTKYDVGPFCYVPYVDASCGGGGMLHLDIPGIPWPANFYFLAVKRISS